MTNVEMAEDMINMNSKNIETSLLMLYKSIGDLLKENYKEQISKIKDERKNMYNEENDKGINNPKTTINNKDSKFCYKQFFCTKIFYISKVS